jgi:hypothetical protein
MSKNFVTRSELNNEFPVPQSRPGLRKWIKERGFPAPVYPTPNCPIWTPEKVVQIEEWFKNSATNHHDAKPEAQNSGK